MQQYEEAFRDNAIDVAILPELTADDLKELGVSLVGHSRKHLAAIAAPVPERPAPDAERRQLTVMFCDLVVPPNCRRGSIPRICARSSPRIIVLSRM